MRRILAGLLILLLPMTGYALSEEAATTLDHQLRAAFRQDETLGAAVALYRDGELVHSLAYGIAVRKGNMPVTSHTLFRTASVTKMVTAVGVLRLVEEGRLDLDADVGQYLGYSVRNPRYPQDRITLRQLLCHTSGIKHNQDYAVKDTTLRKTLREMLCSGENVRANYAERRPGEAYEYSNLGAGMLGSVIEAVTGQSLQAYMQETVFSPLGVAGFYHPAYVPQELVMAVAYRPGQNIRTWDPYRLAVQPFDTGCQPEDHYDLAAGNLMISAQDLGKLASLFCGGGSVGGVRILQPETVAQMLVPQSGIGSVWGETPNGLGICMREDFLAGKTLYGHQGTLGDMLSDVYFLPEEGSVVVLLTNATRGRRENDAYVLARKAMQTGFQALAEPG